jgi:DNA-binding transcriptional ArsR family regulator
MTNDPGPRFHPDPATRVDVTNLRGLAHPLRMRILAVLRVEGPATATTLARRLGESSGATSYHLRQLAQYGFVVEDAGRGTGRERWWRAAQRYTWLDVPEPPPGPDAAGLTEGYLRAVAAAYSARTQAWIDALPVTDPAWRNVGTISDFFLRLTPDEARRLVADLYAVVARYREHDPERSDVPAGAERVALQLQVLPQLGDEAP